jgi:TolB-like protein/DNA-binding winged helix-turn-helix (wHTH) protein
LNLVGNAPFRVGNWRVDPALDEISRDDGTVVKLEPRTMRVLVRLAEHAGDVVSVEELLDTVWKDLVVTSYSVYQAIGALRRALGDNSKDPAYIANVQRRGYRLVASVEPDAKEPQPPPTSAAPPVEAALPQLDRGTPLPVPEVAREGRSYGRRFGLALLVLLAAAGTLWWLASRPRQVPLASVAVGQAASARPPGAASGATFAPPPHTVAVLPFTNLSGDSRQDYFSDGITEELINSLAQIQALKVIARTSSFSFRGKDADIETIARKLNVAAILEGSVRRSGNHVRITAQLIDAVSGFHIWSQDFDRDLNNILNLQTDIATAVAQQLQAKLLGDEAPRIELGGTRSSAAFDAYLRGSKASISAQSAADSRAAIAAYTQAIRLDPGYALALAGRSHAYSSYAEEYATAAAISSAFEHARADARQAIALAPQLAEGYAALGHVLDSQLEFAPATEAYERALALAPGNVQVLRLSADFMIAMGHFEAGLAAARHAVTLDPLNPRSYYLLGQGLYFARRYQEAITALDEAIRLDPGFKEPYGIRGLAYYWLGDLQSARAACERNLDYWVDRWCLAVVYDKLGRRADAEAVLASYQAAEGNAAAYQYATIHAQWGDRVTSLQWLETALRQRDSGLVYLKTDRLLDPVRTEPRFQQIERQLKFPT